jgi:predicted ATPase/DNA-binding CsgD family transcriptional regulator/DNA-binding XRE family transcriptional regulator
MKRAEPPPFADLLRGLRETAGLTQEELAERAGLTGKGISALERGDRRHPYPATVRAIADALELDNAERAALIAAIPSRSSLAEGRSRAEPSMGPSPWPPETSPLVGRDEELDLLKDQLLLAEVRLVTIVGPGGVGKTRLAAAVSRGLVGHPAFPDGVTFVDLSSATVPSVVVSILARALGLTEGAATASLDGLEAFMATRRLLLVLDNLEQVLAAAPDIGRLIGAGTGVTILATSREPLRLRWERTLPLMPLALPDPRHLPDPKDLALVPAVSLFVERARASTPSFRLTAANAAPVAELCVRLDGLPLAIELVAARAAQLGPGPTLDRLANRLPVLGPGNRDAPARHQSLLATLQWSYDLLDEREQSLFRRLAVFAGGWTLAAAEAIAGPESGDVFEALLSLADKSLVFVQEGDEEPRFRMLDTASTHALELLERSGELAGVRLLHARHFADLAEAAAGLMQGAERARTVARLELEEDNFRQALDWARTTGLQDALEEGLRIVGALAWYWFLRGYPPEAREWFEVLLGPESEGEEAEATGRITVLRANALNAAGFRATDQGEYELAARFHERALETWRRLHDVPGLVMALHGVGDTALWLGKADVAERTYREGLELARTEGTPTDVALFAFHLGQLSWLVDRIDDAERYANDALTVAREAANTTWPPYALFILGSVAHERGDIQLAGVRYREAIVLAWEHHDRLGVRMALPGLAALAALEGDSLRAVRLAGAASALEGHAGIWAFPPIRERHERWQQTAEQGLDPTRRAAAWQEGRSMTMEETIAHALEPPPERPDGAATRDALSSREREVLELLARGQSNRAIGEALFVTEHTAKYHVSSLFNKLGATNRAEAVTRAVALGLLTVPED